MRDAALRRIAPTNRIEDLADCDVVVEAVLERFELKREMFGNLDGVCRREAIFATNTSSISVTRIASASKVPSRVIGMHFFNPVPVMQLVEIIRVLQTSDSLQQDRQARRGHRQEGARVEGFLRLCRQPPRSCR